MIKKTIKNRVSLHDKEHKLYDEDYSYKITIFGITAWEKTMDIKHEDNLEDESKIGFQK